jgi:TolB-like protein/DNA-binding winged helix-turn-helix (wHTH) protein/Tfp pilus assembly protein PilF
MVLGRNRAVVRFASFEIDLQSRELRKHGLKLKLQPQPYRVLEMLVRRCGEVVTRDELQGTIWGNTNVDFDRGINKAIRRLRQLLGDSAESPRFIETLPKRGFRFLVPIEDRFTTLAVLPLANLSGDPAEEYFCDGMTDELITSLFHISKVRVISRTSVMRYKGSSKPLAEIATELGADALVEGSVLRSGEKIRVNVSLIRGLDEAQIWRESYQRGVGDPIGLQNQVAEAIARRIGRIVRSTQSSAARPVHAEAHECFLKARHLWNKRTKTDLDRSVEYFERAVAIDPDFACAWAGLADVHLTSGVLGLAPSQSVLQKARTAVLKSLQLEPSLPEAHTCLGELHKFYEWNWEAAEQEYRSALELNPHYAVAHQFYAQLLAMLKRGQEAIHHVEEARRCDPLSPVMNAFVAYIFIQARKYDQAIVEAQRAVELDSHVALTHWFLGQAYQLQNRLAEAVREIETAVRLSGSLSVIQAHLGHLHARAGDRLKATGILEVLQERSLTEYVSPIDFAMIHLGLNHTAEALDWLEEGYRARAVRIPAIGDPFFAEMRSEVRYRGLLARLKLPIPG